MMNALFVASEAIHIWAVFKDSSVTDPAREKVVSVDDIGREKLALNPPAPVGVMEMVPDAETTLPTLMY